MSNRRKRRGDPVGLVAWWVRVASELECARCLEAPPACEVCGVPARSVGAIGLDPGEVDSLREHYHLCIPCREELRRSWGLPRVELDHQRFFRGPP